MLIRILGCKMFLWLNLFCIKDVSFCFILFSLVMDVFIFRISWGIIGTIGGAIGESGDICVGLWWL